MDLWRILLVISIMIITFFILKVVTDIMQFKPKDKDFMEEIIPDYDPCAEVRRIASAVPSVFGIDL